MHIAHLCLQDEAYELGQQWAKIYDADSPPQRLISELMDTSFLVNVVHNDFHDSEAIFQPFFKAGEQYTALQNKTSADQPQINGH